MRPRPYLSQQPVDDFGLGISNHKYAGRCNAVAALTVTVPGDAGRWKAVMEYTDGSEVWVAVNDTAAVPGVAPIAMAATTSQLAPRCLEVMAGDTIEFLSQATAAAVSVAFYAVGSNN